MLVILGPTASGKTRLAAQLAYRMQGEIISADSRQVYRDMTIGTGKDLDEYIVEGQLIPYHLIDSREAGDKYNVHQFQQDAAACIGEILRRHNMPIVCGGSGLYLHALLSNHQLTSVPVDTELRQRLEQLSHEQLREELYQLEAAHSSKADTSTRKRTIRAIEIARYLSAHPGVVLPDRPLPPFQVYGLNPPVEIRRRRISERLSNRLQNGLIEEVQRLLHRGILPENLIYYGLEYKFVTEHLLGVYSLDEMVARLQTEIHRFAKRQMTFFRKMERDGILIHWLPYEQTLEEWIETIVSSQP